MADQRTRTWSIEGRRELAVLEGLDDEAEITLFSGSTADPYPILQIRSVVDDTPMVDEEGEILDDWVAQTVVSFADAGDLARWLADHGIVPTTENRLAIGSETTG